MKQKTSKILFTGAVLVLSLAFLALPGTASAWGGYGGGYYGGGYGHGGYGGGYGGGYNNCCHQTYTPPCCTYVQPVHYTYSPYVAPYAYPTIYTYPVYSYPVYGGYYW